jgi:hypothetical protein
LNAWPPIADIDQSGRVCLSGTARS